MLRMEKVASKYGKLLGMQQKRANVGGPLDLRLAGAVQLFTVKNVSCYIGS